MKNVAITLLITLLMVGCHSSKPIQQAPQAVQVHLVAGHATESGSGIRFSAVVTPDAEAPLAFRVPGYITALKQVRGENGKQRDIAEGDRVSRGAVLVRVRAAEYQDKVRQGSAQVAANEAVALKAKLDFERATRLYASGSITKPDLDAARAQYDSTQEQVKSARAANSEAEISLRDTSLVAPFDGDVVKKTVELGAFVGPSNSVFTVAKTDLVKIIVGVPDTVVRSIKLGQPVDVAIDAFPNRTFHARISRLSSAADNVTRNFDVEVAIPNKDHLLKVGMIGSLQLDGGEREVRGSSLQVPLAAIVQAKDGKYGVFVVSSSNAGQVASLHNVDIGAVNGTDIAVLSGVAAGDRIITSGANLLKDGQRVEVVQ